MCAVEVNTNEFIFSHRKEPRGYGLWMFEIGGLPFEYTGRYAVAKKFAIKYAQAKNITAIKVLP